MGNKSAIEWTEATWNPVRGCEQISPGCDHCYAKTFAERWRGISGHPFEQGFDVRLVPEKLPDPLSWKRPRMVFVNSMSDLFHQLVPDDYIDRVFGVMAISPRHTYQVLTKRPGRMLAYLTAADVVPRIRAAAAPFCRSQADRDALAQSLWPLPNVWLGTSVEDQHWCNARLPILLECPAAIRFISAEPLLGPIDLKSDLGGTRWIGGQRGCDGSPERSGARHRGPGTPDCPRELHHHHDNRCRRGLDWVIIGGESGPGARPCNVAWIRKLVHQCGFERVACFVKQMGARPQLPDEPEEWFKVQMAELQQWPTGTSAARTPEGFFLDLKHPKGGDPTEWPERYRVREFPGCQLDRDCGRYEGDASDIRLDLETLPNEAATGESLGGE